ncbi:MAG: adenylate/guanylate cyclase domain-containing protein, partial [Chitinophagales bacterium]
MQHDRHLAAILFSDIVGYSGMMQQDEVQAMNLINHYQAVLKSSVSAHAGKILNDYGDGNLCTFPSAFEALKCAIELQAKLREEPAVPLRIGLHIGEIFLQNRKVFGDGVNIASRIQSLAIGNSILISSAFHNNIKNQSEFNTVSIGQFHFKNIDEPMEVFALANPGLVVPKPNEIHGKLKDIPQKAGRFRWIAVFSIIAIFASMAWYFTSHKNAQKTTESSENINVRSIAVLPFDDYSPKKDQAWFTDGMTDALITELSKISSLIVRSHTSVM